MQPLPVFLSWSGERSRALAEALRDWLPEVIVLIKPWFSEKDIDKGSRWSTELAEQLSTTDLAVICVTPENTESAWMLFEAGSLGKSREARLWVYSPDSAMPSSSPLRQFQCVTADEEGTRALVASIAAKVLPSEARLGFLTRQFDRCWPDLRMILEQVRASRPTVRVSRRMNAEEMVMRGPDILRSLATKTAADDLLAAIVKRFSATAAASNLGDQQLTTVARFVCENDIRAAEAYLEGFGFKSELRVTLILQILFYSVGDARTKGGSGTP